MTNPQYTLSFSLGVGEEGLKRRECYEKAAGNRSLAEWMREVLDEAAKKGQDHE